MSMSGTSESEFGASDFLETLGAAILMGVVVTAATSYAAQAVYGHSAVETLIVSLGTGVFVAVATPLAVYAVARLYYETLAEGTEATTEQTHE